MNTDLDGLDGCTRIFLAAFGGATGLMFAFGGSKGIFEHGLRRIGRMHTDFVAAFGGATGFVWHTDFRRIRRMHTDFFGRLRRDACSIDF